MHKGAGIRLSQINLLQPHLYEKGEEKLVVFIAVSDLLTNEFSFCIGQKNSVFSPLVLVTI